MTRPELDAETKARIEAEEAYRRQLKSQATQRRGYGCAAWGCGGLALAAIALMGLSALGRSSGNSTSSDRRVDFVVNCEYALKDQLKSPATAKISNAFADGILSTASGYAWDGTVDAQNGFGALIRSRFRCQGSPESPTVTME